MIGAVEAEGVTPLGQVLVDDTVGLDELLHVLGAVLAVVVL